MRPPEQLPADIRPFLAPLGVCKQESQSRKSIPDPPKPYRSWWNLYPSQRRSPGVSGHRAPCDSVGVRENRPSQSVADEHRSLPTSTLVGSPVPDPGICLSAQHHERCQEKAPRPHLSCWFCRNDAPNPSTYPSRPNHKVPALGRYPASSANLGLPNAPTMGAPLCFSANYGRPSLALQCPMLPLSAHSWHTLPLTSCFPGPPGPLVVIWSSLNI